MIERRTLSDEVYQHLLREIMSGRLPAGHTLDQHVLALTLSVPRTAVREAVWQLGSHGVVDPRGRQAVVRRFGPAQVRHVFEIRQALESLAAELACGRMTKDDFGRLDRLLSDVPPRGAPHHQEACHRLDHELHALIAQRCGNPLLRREIDQLGKLVQIVRFHFAGDHEGLDAALRAHIRIIEALRERNAPAARRLMAEHIREAGDVATRWVLGEEAAADELAALEPVR